MTTWWGSVRQLVDANRYLRIIVATGRGWSEVHVSRLAASLSFFALLSLIPLLVTCHAIFSLIMDEHALSLGMAAQIAGLIGAQQANAVRSMLEHAQSPSFASVKAMVGSLLTFLTAGGVFIDLKDSMDAIWKAPKRERSGLLRFVGNYFAPLSMVLGFGFLMLVSLFLNALVTSAVTSFAGHHAGLLAAIEVGNETISLIVSLILFASIFRFLPAATIAWGDVWLGSSRPACSSCWGGSSSGCTSALRISPGSTVRREPWWPSWCGSTTPRRSCSSARSSPGSTPASWPRGIPPSMHRHQGRPPPWRMREPREGHRA